MSRSYWAQTRHSQGGIVATYYPEATGGAEGNHPLFGLLGLDVDANSNSWVLRARKRRKAEWAVIATGAGEWTRVAEGSNPILSVERAAEIRTGWRKN